MATYARPIWVQPVPQYYSLTWLHLTRYSSEWGNNHSLNPGSIKRLKGAKVQGHMYDNDTLSNNSDPNKILIVKTSSYGIKLLHP